MCNLSKSGYVLVDEIDLEAHLLRKNIAEIIQDTFAWEINRLVHGEARSCCEACKIDDPSQRNHECMMDEEEEIWIFHFERVKEHLNIEKLWSVIERRILVKLNVYLEDKWLKYLYKLLEISVTTAFLLFKDFERREIDDEAECLKLGCYMISYSH